jgi:Protein of Unknown function (DUF2604)
MPSEQNIDVTVVVSGQPVRLQVNVHQTVEHLIHAALQESSNKGQAPSEWELRTESGTLLNPSARIADVGLAEGVTLFLNPRAGAGG